MGFFAFAVVAATYSEQTIVFGILFCLMGAGDLLLREGRVLRANLWILLAGAAGLVMTGAYALSWLPFIVKHIANVSTGSAGFWQPQWATVVDILGYKNIYIPAEPFFAGRSWGTALALGLVSLAAAELAILQLWTRRGADVAYWLAPPLFVALVFTKSFYIGHQINYTYMKAYTILLLPLVALHAWTLTSLTSRGAGPKTAENNRPWVSVSMMFFPALIIFMGVGYLRDYSSTSLSLPKGVAVLWTPKVSAVLRDSAVIIAAPDKVPNSLKISNMTLGGYAELLWLNLNYADPFLPPHAGKRILLLALKRDLADSHRIERRNADRIVVQNDDVLLVDTGLRVEIPNYQVGLPGLMPIDRRNPASPTWPLNLAPRWSAISDSVLR